LADGLGLREIKVAELNNVIEARANEILENVYARLEATGILNSLGAGIVISGGGAALKDLQEVMSERLKMEVRFTPIRKGVIANGDLVVSNNPEYAVAVGLLMKGTKNCALYIPPKPEPKPVIEKEEPVQEVKEEVKKEPEQPQVKPSRKKNSGSWWKNWTQKAENIGRDLFNESENGETTK
jgi:cell division protein FtsA